MEHRGIAREGDAECTDNDCRCHDPAQNAALAANTPGANRVWLATKGTEKALRLAEADGWEVHEVARAPTYRPNSLENIHRDMDLLQQIHRDSLQDELSAPDSAGDKQT